jgi:predicted nucleotidyltransferase
VNLSAPAEAVVPTLDGPVLLALAKLSGPVTGRQVHQLTGTGSEAGVRKVLARLVRHGLVRESPAGAAYLYSINREHLAWPAVQELAGMRGQLLARLRHVLGEWGVRARCAALFGSAARGDGDVDSDIDVLVIRQRRVSADDESWQAQLDQLRDDVRAWTGNSCQIYELGSDDLQRHIAAGDPMVAAWRTDAITIAGTDLRGLLRDLGHRASA